MSDIATTRASLTSQGPSTSSSTDLSPEHIIAEFREGLDEKFRNLLSDRECTRFINARPKSIRKACEMATAWYEWRHSLLKPFPPSHIQYTPNVILLCPDQPYDHPFIHLTPVCHNGFDKEGSPIYWERTGLIQSNFGEVKKHFTADQLVLYHIQSQEVAMMRLAYASKVFGKEVHQITAVFDMKYLTMSLDMECIYYIKAILDIDQAFYPECLKTLFIINCPWYFTGIYSMFKPFIDKKTSSKFQLLGSNYLPTLEKYIDRSQIPSEMGGDRENYPWLQFAPNSGATENDLIEHLLRTYNPYTIADLLNPNEMELLQEAIETRGQRLKLPPDTEYSEHAFPTLLPDQRSRLSSIRPKNCHEAFLALVAIPDFIVYSKEIFPSLTDEQLALLQADRPKTLHRICHLLKITDLCKSELNLQKVMNWLLTNSKAHPELADRPEVSQLKDEYHVIVQGVLAIYFYAIRWKNEKSSGSESTEEAVVTARTGIEDPSQAKMLKTVQEVPPGQFLSLDNVEDTAFDDTTSSGTFLGGSSNSGRRRSNEGVSSPISRSVSNDIGNRQVTWAQAAGRQAGSPDYQFGDLTKSVVRKVTGSQGTGKSSFTSTTSSTSGSNSPPSQLSLSALSLMKTKIVRAERTVEALMYVINVTYKESKSWQVQRRYNDFVELYSYLEQLDSRASFPSLPPKVYLGSSSSAGVIKARIPKLDAFLAAVVDYVSKANVDLRAEYCPLLFQFIDPSGNRYEPVTPVATAAGNPVVVGMQAAAAKESSSTRGDSPLLRTQPSNTPSSQAPAPALPVKEDAKPVSSSNSVSAPAASAEVIDGPDDAPLAQTAYSASSVLKLHLVLVVAWVATILYFCPDEANVSLLLFGLIHLAGLLLFALFVEICNLFG